MGVRNAQQECDRQTAVYCVLSLPLRPTEDTDHNTVWIWGTQTLPMMGWLVVGWVKIRLDNVKLLMKNAKKVSTGLKERHMNT